MMELLGDLKHVLVYIDTILFVQKVGKSEANYTKKIDDTAATVASPQGAAEAMQGVLDNLLFDLKEKQDH